MDQHKTALLEALKAGARQSGEHRLYARGKFPGLFTKRTRLNAEAANQAIQDGLLEVTLVETVGKTTIEWVRVTQAGVDFLLESESPMRALEELRAALAVNEQGLPLWIAQMHARIDDLSRSFSDELTQMRQRLDQLAQRTTQAIERIESAQTGVAKATTVPWGPEALEQLECRKQVGLGERCALGELFTALKEKHAELTLKEFHTGLKRLQERQMIALFPSTSQGDAPGPEYAMLDGAAVYYYVGRLAA